MKFTFLTGDIDYSLYGGKWISTKQHDEIGNYDYAYVIELINIHEATGETNSSKYVVRVEMVATTEVSLDDKQSAMDCNGYSEKFEDLDWEMQIEVLFSYGTSANLMSYYGANFNKLLKEAKDYCKNLEPNDVLDEPANQIGSTKRDFLRGDSLAGLKRYEDIKEVTKAVVSVQGDISTIDQSKLTSDCFLIQISGPDACKTCEVRDNHTECSGMEIRKKLKML